MANSRTFPERVLPFQFDGRRITVADMLEATSRVLSILKEIDARSTGVPEGTLDWVVQDLRSGSAVFEIYAEPRGERTPMGIPELVVDRFKRGMRQVVQTGSRPEYFTEYAMRRVFELTTVLNENGIEAFRIGTNGEAVELRPAMRKAVRETLEGRYRTIGSLEGRIDSLAAHEEPYSCTVYSELSGEPVRCYFAAEMLHEVYAAFRKRVAVHGTFNTRANGEVTSMRLSRIVPLEAPDLPGVDEMIGILSHGA